MKKTKMHGIILLIIACGLTVSGHGQPRQQVTQILFRQGGYQVNPDFNTNRAQLDTLFALLHTIKTQPARYQLQRIDVQSFASPEGGKTLNDQLCQRRSVRMIAYLEQATSLPATYFAQQQGGVAWQQLRHAVVDSQVPDRQAVLRILDSVPEQSFRGNVLVDSRNHQLMRLAGGVPYRYLLEHLFPALRYSAVNVHYSQQPAPIPPQVLRDTVVRIERDTVYVPVPVLIPAPEPQYKPLFAIKTNLLYDIALTPNVEIEVPIGDRWSINGEFMRGWWLRKHTFCWEVEGYGIEGRYWFGDRSRRRVLTGWFAGAYVSGGFYDLQLKDTRGSQGDCFSAGISAGYGMQIARNWSIEFSASVGYFRNEYRRYNVIDNDYLLQDGAKRRYEALLPTKAKISLVWLLNRSVKKGGTR